MSIARHFVAKLGANLVGLVLSVATLALVPRLLGPAMYGRYEFLANFFQQIRGFVDMGTSTCFYTRLSQRPWDAGLVQFYRNLVIGATGLIVAAAAVLAATPAGTWLWAGESVGLVAWAALFGCLTWWVDSVRKLIDAYHLTVAGEIQYVVSRAVTLLLLLAIIWWGTLDLQGYFVYQIVTSIVVVAVLLRLAKRARFEPPAATEPVTRQSYTREFWSYSHPLFLYALVGVITGIADRWLLQTQAGAVQQGLYGLAFQVGAACFLFTSAMTQLLMREFASAWARNDLQRMRDVFRRIVPLLYTITAYFCVFTSYRAADVSYLVGGNAFEQGSFAMSLMVLYPMHQTYGQLSGSVFYATGATRLYRNIGVVGMVVGLPLMYMLIAAPASGGLGLGATGLALKMVLLQVVMVNVQLWFNAKLLSLGYWKFILHQITVPAVLIVFAYASTLLVDQVSLSRLGNFLATGVLYTALTAGIAWVFPQLCGLHRGDITRLTARFPLFSSNRH